MESLSYVECIRSFEFSTHSIIVMSFLMLYIQDEINRFGVHVFWL